jgi:uncharacterized protein YdiU (UPF0061 family)
VNRIKLKVEEKLGFQKSKEKPETVQAKLLGYLQREGIDTDRFLELSTGEQQKQLGELYIKYSDKAEIIKEISCFFD